MTSSLIFDIIILYQGDSKMKVIIKDIEGFGNVFGADCFIEQFPELLNGRGIFIEKRNDFYYVVNDKGEIFHDTCFFTEDELEYLEIIDKSETLH